MFPFEFAEFLLFNSTGRIPFFLGGYVIAPLALGAGKGYGFPHFLTFI